METGTYLVDACHSQETQEIAAEMDAAALRSSFPEQVCAKLDPVLNHVRTNKIRNAPNLRIDKFVFT